MLSLTCSGHSFSLVFKEPVQPCYSLASTCVTAEQDCDTCLCRALGPGQISTASLLPGMLYLLDSDVPSPPQASREHARTLLIAARSLSVWCTSLTVIAFPKASPALGSEMG